MFPQTGCKFHKNRQHAYLVLLCNPVLAQCLLMLNENKMLCLFKACGDVLEDVVLALVN